MHLTSLVASFVCSALSCENAGTPSRQTNSFARERGSVSNLEEAEAAQSRPDFISKVRIALKEARECHYWLRIVEATAMVTPQRIHPLVEEANELVAILTKIVKTASTPKSPPTS